MRFLPLFYLLSIKISIKKETTQSLLHRMLPAHGTQGILTQPRKYTLLMERMRTVQFHMALFLVHLTTTYRALLIFSQLYLMQFLHLLACQRVFR